MLDSDRLKYQEKMLKRAPAAGGGARASTKLCCVHGETDPNPVQDQNCLKYNFTGKF